MIETERLILREWRDADRPVIADINAHPEVMRFLGEPLSRERSDAAITRMMTLATAGNPFFFAVERKSDKVLLGFAGISTISFTAPFGEGFEIGWRFGVDYWGQGYASEAAAAALQDGFERHLLDRIFAFTSINNRKSEAVMQRIGMHRACIPEFDHPGYPEGHHLRPNILYLADRKPGGQ